MLSDLKILVTHVTHFVGLPTALELARQGATVVCHDRSFANLEVLRSFTKTHPTLKAVPHGSAGLVFYEAETLVGPLDALVSNDFYPAVRASVDTASVEDLRASLEDLVVVPFTFAAEAARRMKERRRGKIVFITSAAPFHGLPNYSMYVTGRGAANALTVSLAQELAPFNIQVNAVAPNYVESPSYFPPSLIENAEAMKRFTEKVPLKRLGKPEEVAAAIAFLISPGSNFMTGHVMPVAGGWA